MFTLLDVRYKISCFGGTLSVVKTATFVMYAKVNDWSVKKTAKCRFENLYDRCISV